MAQNWDWMEEQSPNLLLLTIIQPDKPTIKMVTEAGIIGKIGLNSAGVGVCLNAIRIPGLDKNRIPCTLVFVWSWKVAAEKRQFERFGTAVSHRHVICSLQMPQAALD